MQCSLNYSGIIGFCLLKIKIIQFPGGFRQLIIFKAFDKSDFYSPG